MEAQLTPKQKTAIINKRALEQIMMKLDEITSKGVNELNEANIAHLRARRFYLTPAQLKQYKSVLEVKEEKPKKPVKPAGKGKGNALSAKMIALQDNATQLGIDHKGKSEEELQELIDENLSNQ